MFDTMKIKVCRYVVVSIIVALGSPAQTSAQQFITPIEDDATGTAQPATDVLPPWQRMLTGEDLERAEALFNQITSLRERGKYAAAIPLAEEILTVRQRVQGADHWKTGDAARSIKELTHIAHYPQDVQMELAEVDASLPRITEMRQQGRNAEALELIQANLVVLRRVLGDDHLFTQDLNVWMSSILIDQRKLSEAETILRDALERYRQELGKDHPKMIKLIHTTGRLFEFRDDLYKAEAYYRDSLRGFRRVFGDEDPYTLTNARNLGRLLVSMGNLSEAELLIREVFDTCRTVLGEDHPVTKSCNNTMAYVLFNQQNFAEAEPFLRKNLVSARESRGDDDPNTLVTVFNMGHFLSAQNKIGEAAPYTHLALEGFRRMLGEDHPFTLEAMDELGQLYLAQGKLSEAESYISKALAGRRRVLGNDHTDTLHSLIRMGWLLRAQEKLSEAEPYFREALEGFRNKHGDNHSFTLTKIRNMAILFQDQGRLSEAEPLLRRVLETQRQVFGKKHPVLAESLNSLAYLSAAKGDYATAETLWAEAADIYESTRLKVSHDGLDRLHYAAKQSPFLPLAACLARRSKFRSAWEYYEANLARGLLDALSTRHVRPLDAAERRREISLLGRINSLDERISALSGQKEAVDQAEEAQDKLKSYRDKREGLLAEWSQFEREMTAKYGAAAGEVYPLARIQARLSADSALLGWVDIEGDPHAVEPHGEHWACVVRHEGEPSWIKLPGSGEGEEWTASDSGLAKGLRRILRAGSSGQAARRQQELIQRLHEQRIAPVEPHLPGIRHLIILPAGRLSGIPVELLTDNYAVSYCPSGTMYAWLKEKTGVREGKTSDGHGSLLALGDPVFRKQKELSEAQPDLPKYGVLVTSMTADSNAARNGIQRGDILLAYGGETLAGPGDLAAAVEKAAEDAPQAKEPALSGTDRGEEKTSGDSSEVPVQVWRDGRTLEKTVSPGKLGIRPAMQPAPEAMQFTRRLDDAMEVARGPSFNPLPGTRREVEAIGDLFKQDKDQTGPLLLLGADASERRLETLSASGELAKFRFLHLATHGVMDGRRALQSALILSQEELPDSIEQVLDGKEIYDGRLTGEQIVRTWKLDADLVTLSGCDTALGQEAGGEGYLGFSQALFVAGAPSLVLSLWRVDDQATMLLMRRFYENMLGRFDEEREVLNRKYRPGDALPKSEALLEAKCWLRTYSTSPSVRPYEDPHYWAAFILIGDPD